MDNICGVSWDGDVDFDDGMNLSYQQANRGKEAFVKRR